MLWTWFQQGGSHVEGECGFFGGRATIGIEADQSFWKGFGAKNGPRGILLKSDIGGSDEEISQALDVGVATVERVRRK